ncbi:MAG: DUF2793 domain-containing protein [Pseudomonadota bacterium]
MSQPITFPSTTPYAGLPLLFSGQSQKEFFLNQALATIDAMLIRSINASLSQPPADAAEGESYRILAGATDDWANQDESIAVRIGGGWHFISPLEGMEVYDRSAGQKLVFKAAWQNATRPEEPTGGSVVDVEARAAIADLMSALETAGLLSDGA